MPKIEVNEEAFFQFVGQRLEGDSFEELLTIAKAELDGREEGLLKIELNDTNRPDLWSTAGLARQLRIYLTRSIPEYDFFSTPEKQLDSEDRTIEVDPKLKDIRPYIAGFAVRGKKLDEPELKDLIQTQEKLCWNYGRKRQSIAMGVYRHDRMSYPVHYTAADPDATEFVPLGMENPLSLRKILTEHPKGQDFGWIVKDFPSFPYLTDNGGDTLSFPPVINSASLGAVQVGDEELFIELTGTDLDSLLIATSVVACDLADSGFTVLPVTTRYPYDTKYGREIVAPFYFQQPISLEVAYGNRLLGLDLSPEEAASCVERMGCPAIHDESSISITVPQYRNDFLHPVDVVEDVMMGKGLGSFEPQQPGDFTVGRVTEIETLSRQVKGLMVGLGYQEMIFNYLGSGRDYRDRMQTAGEELVRVANPMTENYEYVRSSIFPALLSAEAVSANASYPHLIFEVGKVARLDDRDTSGTVTRDYLAFLSSDGTADFNSVRAQVSVLFYYLSVEHGLREVEDPRFISGRAAELLCKDEPVGIVGEIHPQVLENWGIQMPCAGCEIDLSTILEKLL